LLLAKKTLTLQQFEVKIHGPVQGLGEASREKLAETLSASFTNAPDVISRWRELTNWQRALAAGSFKVGLKICKKDPEDIKAPEHELAEKKIFTASFSEDYFFPSCGARRRRRVGKGGRQLIDGHAVSSLIHFPTTGAT